MYLGMNPIQSGMVALTIGMAYDGPCPAQAGEVRRENLTRAPALPLNVYVVLHFLCVVTRMWGMLGTRKALTLLLGISGPGARFVSNSLGLPRWLHGRRICLPMQEMQEMWVQSLGRENPLEKEMATCSSILAWKIPWTEESVGLRSMGSQRVRLD